MNLYINNIHTKRFFIFILLFVAFAFTTDRVSAEQDNKHVQEAKKLISEKHGVSVDKLKVINEATAQYRFSGKKAQAVKFVDEKGKIYGLTLDENGTELNHEELVKEDLAVKHTKYGKFEPAFFDKIKNESENKPLKVTLVLKFPPYTSIERPDAKEKLTKSINSLIK